MFKFVGILLLAAFALAEKSAIVVIHQDPVSGQIKFTEIEGGVHIEGEISGLSPGKHGFHVHAKGDLSGGCLTAGGHLNPHNKSHGAPEDSERHVGDLGNIVADNNGVAHINFNDSLISICSPETGIVGRALVIHEKEDDLGKGGHKDSLTTGNAGGRVGCGVIGFLTEESCSGAAAGTISLMGIILSVIVAVRNTYSQ